MLTAATGGAKLEEHTPLGAMSDEQLKTFLAAVQADAGLQEQLKAASDTDAVAIAKAAGFVISAEELKRAQAEISEEELEAVVGGVRDRFRQQINQHLLGQTGTRRTAPTAPQP